MFGKVHDSVSQCRLILAVIVVPFVKVNPAVQTVGMAQLLKVRNGSVKRFHHFCRTTSIPRTFRHILPSLFGRDQVNRALCFITLVFWVTDGIPKVLEDMSRLVSCSSQRTDVYRECVNGRHCQCNGGD